MPELKEPSFKRKAKCVISDRPKFKRDNIVFRSDGRRMVVERVVAHGKSQHRVAQPWPKDLLLVVRGPIARRVIKHFNSVTIHAANERTK